MIKQFQNEMQALMNRSVDRHLRLAVTGLSRSGKTAFITALVNQLLSVNSGARLPLFTPVREERLLGVRRVPQQDMGVARFTYDEGLAQLYGTPPAWPTPTRGVSEIRLALRYRSRESLLRHFKDTSTLWLDIVDYPGEWLLDLPMLAQDYLMTVKCAEIVAQHGVIEIDRRYLKRVFRIAIAGADIAHACTCGKPA